MYDYHYNAHNDGSHLCRVLHSVLVYFERYGHFRDHVSFANVQRLTGEFPSSQIQQQTIVKQSIVSAVFLKRHECSRFFSHS